MSKRCCAAQCFNSNALVNNNGVNYFAFPRSLEYCQIWAKAASRLDLLDKDLLKLIKYYLCSDHFEPHCFLDPETKTRLKKSIRPVVVPIPTIFKCNFNEIVPQTVGSTSIKPIKPTKTIPNVLRRAKRPRQTNTIEVIEIQEQNEEPTIYTLSENEPVVLLNKDYVYHEPGICRLCCTSYSPDELTPIFENPIVEVLELILPGEILPVDGLPDSVCESCIGDLNTVNGILTNIRTSQTLLLRPTSPLDE